MSPLALDGGLILAGCGAVAWAMICFWEWVLHRWERSFKKRYAAAVSEFDHDSLREHGHVLKGRYAHYCPEWDGMTIDETCPEFDTCSCYGYQSKEDTV